MFQRASVDQAKSRPNLSIFPWPPSSSLGSLQVLLDGPFLKSYHLSINLFINPIYQHPPIPASGEPELRYFTKGLLGNNSPQSLLTVIPTERGKMSFSILSRLRIPQFWHVPSELTWLPRTFTQGKLISYLFKGLTSVGLILLCPSVNVILFIFSTVW